MKQQMGITDENEIHLCHRKLSVCAIRAVEKIWGRKHFSSLLFSCTDFKLFFQIIRGFDQQKKKINFY